MSLEKLTEYFKYLDNLRASGKTNMFGAPIYVEKKFNISWNEASYIVGKWMDTFDNIKVEERAKIALGA